MLRIQNLAGEQESANPSLTGRNWPEALSLRAREHGFHNNADRTKKEIVMI
jgi:hypothetical protein